MSEHKEFLEYYHAFKDKIHTYFWYRVNFDQTTAEDLTSEVFIKAFRHFDTFDRERSFQAWIYKIAKNHLLNWYRVAGRELALEHAETVGHNPKTRTEAALELEQVIGEMQRLDDYHREVLLLRFVDGLDNNEIASLLDKDEGAVRTQISRALKKLREQLLNKKR